MLKKAAFVIAFLALASVVGVSAAGEEPHAVNGKILLGYSEQVSPPETKCVGGELVVPLPPYYLPCSPETTRVIGRSEVQIWMPASPSKSVAKLLNGPITFVVDCDLNAAYRGPCWGTFEWKVEGVGTWTGFWTAPIMDLVTYESRLSMEGIGSGGKIDGKHLELNGVSAPGDWYIAFTVRIR